MASGADVCANKKTASSRKFPMLLSSPLSDKEPDKMLEPGTSLNGVGSSRDVYVTPQRVFERTMGDTEASYYLPSRADGVNDMYLHLGFRAPVSLLIPARVRVAWAYIRLVHPSLGAHVRMEACEYTSARFAYSPPRSVTDALTQADITLVFKQEAKDALIDTYLNGPRTLGDDRLACLIIGHVPTEKNYSPLISTLADSSTDQAKTFLPVSSPPIGEKNEFDLLICVTHFLADGIAVHTLANELLMLIAGKNAEGREKSVEELEEMLELEWKARWSSGKQISDIDVFPPSMEEALPKFNGRFRNAAAKVDFKNNERRDIGGHAFARKKSASRHTVVPTIALDPKKTRAVVNRCRENGVPVGSAIISLCSIAWSRIKAREEAKKRNSEAPIMLYTALNVRSYLLPSVTANRSYFSPAIGYLNIILPSFLPSSHDSARALQKTFWLRARSVKKQISQAAKHPLVLNRTREMARARAERARMWAREDDEKDAGIWISPKPSPKSGIVDDSKNPWTLPPAPSTALIGLSLLGDLDGMYNHTSYPSLVLHTLTSGTRQRPGGALLFGYTFVGRLWLSLGFDEQGFEEGVMQEWWNEFLKCVGDFLVGDGGDGMCKVKL